MTPFIFANEAWPYFVFEEIIKVNLFLSDIPFFFVNEAVCILIVFYCNLIKKEEETFTVQ